MDQCSARSAAEYLSLEWAGIGESSCGGAAGRGTGPPLEHASLPFLARNPFELRQAMASPGQKKYVRPRLKLRGMEGETTLALIAPS